MIIELFVWGIVIYFIYKFVFELVVPITKAATQMKQTVDQMQRQQRENHTPQQPPVKPKPTTTNTNEEYIDFEEVK